MRARPTLLLAVVAATSVVSGVRTQLPLGNNFDLGTGFNLLAPESSPASITTEGFTTVSHPDHKDHSVRIKRTDGWCDPDVVSYTGYLDNGPRHLFFYFFESRRNPDKDDLVLWTNGGPGCSSSMGLLMELGPCTIQRDGNSTKPNPYSWSNKANFIFIDQPIGVGFSYSDAGVTVDTTEQAAIDVHAFLNIFLETFPKFKGRGLHLSGESYGGRYIPVFASEILYQNSLLARKKSSVEPINLKSVIIGNGLTDIVSMATSYYDQACTAQNGIGKPVLNAKQCIAMQQDVSRCDEMLTKVCRKSLVQPECDIATEYCGNVLEIPFLDAQINPYDISKPCTTLGTDLCYPETSVIKTYLDQPWVRQTLGVQEGLDKFQSCSNKVAMGFAKTKDSLAPTFYHLTALLENNVKVLIYVGKHDWICNYIGNYNMLQSLSWSGQSGFVQQPLTTWNASNTFDTAISGETKSFGPLTFATIRGAGHMVPLDKPEEALSLFTSWIEGEGL